MKRIGKWVISKLIRKVVCENVCVLAYVRACNEMCTFLVFVSAPGSYEMEGHK